MRTNEHLRRVYSRMSGRLFALSVQRGYDSEKFAEIVLTSDYGQRVYDDIIMSEWLEYTYVMEGYEREFRFPKGVTYSEDAMYFAGWLYRYWAITHETPIKEIYKVAPLSLLIRRYPFYHTQDEEYVINDILQK